MKYIKLFVALMLLASFTGCIEDKGNYDYIMPEQVLPVIVKGLPEKATFAMSSEVNLTPILEGLPKSEDAYEFTWYSYPLVMQGLPVRDTIGRSKNLKSIITYPPGVNRNLTFVIRDKQTNVCSFTEILISIQAIPIGAGYYIAKDINGETDVDYISVDGVMYSDVLSSYSGKKLAGKAVKTFYQGAFYRHTIAYEDGTTESLYDQSVLHVLSESDGVTLNAGTFQVFKVFDQMFYGPVEHRPTDIFIGNFMGDMYIMNAGNVSTIYGMGENAGIYGDSKSRSDNTEPELFPKFLVCDYPSTALCFDVQKRSFCYTTINSTRMTNAAAQPSGKADLPSAVNMDMELISLLDRSDFFMLMGGAPGWAIMRSVSQPYKYYIADLLYSNNAYPFSDFDQLGSNRKLPYGEVFAANRITPAIYFANGNKISYYTKNAEDANSEEVEITFQSGQLTAGEQVVYMDHLYAFPDLTNEFAVLTNNAGNWKLYLFPIISGTARLDTGNAKIYTGTGNARHVMLRN